MQVVLVMFRGNGDRRSFSIARDVTIIGRREDCDFRIPLGEISRKHCRLIKDEKGLRVEDLGSSNGTYRNGERVQSAELEPGDTVQVGSVAFVVQIDAVPADEELHPIIAPTRASAGRAEFSETAGDEPLDALAGVDPADVVHNRADHSASGGEFDPMSVLEGDAEDSGSMPVIDDIDMGDSAAAPTIDVSGESDA